MRDWFFGVLRISRFRFRSWISVAILLVLTEAIYVPPSIFRASLFGADYLLLHIRRIAFAQSGLFGARHTLPGWYPHELLGAPFSANLQSFPLIPNRLVLLLLDPTIAYGVGVALAAALAALFAYLYARRIGLSEIGSVTAGWTFACAGYFATRVAAGHLPLLEAYPSLPLLLWLADRAISSDRTQYQARDLAALALASACVAVAGHPQVPVYSMAATLLYIAVRSRAWRRVRAVCAMACGLGATLFAWWPMLLLIRRSTRLLALAEPSNDIVMPYHRVLALIVPGIDGWPDIVSYSNQHPFGGYPNYAYFWDTASYIGLVPLVAILFLLFGSVVKRRLPRWPWLFLAALGVGAFLFALPLADPSRRMIPGTLLRSPARLLYLSTFSTAIALGAGVDAFLRSSLLKLRAKQALVACCLIFHLVDLGGFSRLFVQTVDAPIDTPQFEQILSREAGDARVAIELELKSLWSDRYDGPGIFDSILLANPYRAVLGLNESPRDLNVQDIDGAALSVPALQGTGVRFVVTSTERQDLTEVTESDAAYLYRVPDPAPRAAFFAESSTDFLPRDKILDEFLAHRRTDRLLLPSHGSTVHRSNQTGGAASVVYERPSSDEIRVRTSTEEAGFVEVLESYDPGWSAAVDGVHAPVVLANGFSMAVPIATGKHKVRLWYETPGRAAGFVLSLISICLLGGLIWTARR
jgi:hypothetical protein